MNTVTSSAPTLRPLGRIPGLRAVPAAFRQRGRELRQVGTFAAIGVVSTLAYVALYALVRPFVSAGAANVIALVATAITRSPTRPARTTTTTTSSRQPSSSSAHRQARSGRSSGRIARHSSISRHSRPRFFAGDAGR